MTDLEQTDSAIDTAVTVVYGVLLAVQVVLVVDYLTDGRMAKFLSAEGEKLARKATRPIGIYREWHTHRHEPVFEAMQVVDAAAEAGDE